MENFNKLKEEIKLQLDSAKYVGDLSDLGNEIGVVIAKYLTVDDTFGDFIRGLKHGISLIDGTHG